jgi:hypothetical protein
MQKFADRRKQGSPESWGSWGGWGSKQVFFVVFRMNKEGNRGSKQVFFVIFRMNKEESSRKISPNTGIEYCDGFSFEFAFTLSAFFGKLPQFNFPFYTWGRSNRTAIAPTYFALTTNTEHGASATTSALTEPSKIRLTPVKPRQPIAIKSTL